MIYLKVFEGYQEEPPVTLMRGWSEFDSFCEKRIPDMISQLDRNLFKQAADLIIGILNKRTNIGSKSFWKKGPTGNIICVLNTLSVEDSEDVSSSGQRHPYNNGPVGSARITYGVRFRINDGFIDEYYITFYRFKDDWYAVEIYVPEFGSPDGGDHVYYICDSRDGLESLPNFINGEIDTTDQVMLESHTQDPSVCVLKRSDQHSFYKTHNKCRITNSDRILFDQVSHSIISLLNRRTRVRNQMSIIQSDDLDSVDRGANVITFGTEFEVSDGLFDSYHYILFHKFEDDWFVVSLHIPDFYSIGGNDGTDCVSYLCDSRDGLRDLPEFIKKERNIKGNIKKLNESDTTLSKRSKQLSEDEFLKILREKCKDFSFKNDLLWRSKPRKNDLEIFIPNYRDTKHVLAFPKFFDEIETNPDYPVVRKKSLIGGTNPDTCKRIGDGRNVYLVIPFDGSEMVFCPIFDLWALNDDRRSKSELVSGRGVSQDNFIKVNYEKGFVVPIDALGHLPNSRKVSEAGVEFFTSSPCLLVHESKVDWLRNNIDTPMNEAYFANNSDTWEEVDDLEILQFRQDHPTEDLTTKDVEDILKIFTNKLSNLRKGIPVRQAKYSIHGTMVTDSNNIYHDTFGSKLKIDIGIYKHIDEWFTIRIDIPPDGLKVPPGRRLSGYRTIYYICDGLRGLIDFYESNLE